MTTPQIAAYGLAVSMPSGWEARVALRTPATAQERTYPVMHLASFPLPVQRDDFGGDVTATMRSSDVFVVLFEYGPESVGQPLFSAEGIPRVDAQMFAANRLQRPVPGQVGCQLFFTAGGRAFCLYVVAGSRASLPRIVGAVNDALGALQIERAGP